MLAKLVLVVSLFVCPSVFPGAAQSQEDSSSRLRALFDACDRPDIPGGFAAAVIKDGDLLFAKAYGYANSEDGVPFTTQTEANYASVAKQFTGYAAAMLIQDGQLNLDDDVRHYLPDLPDFGPTITVRHLLYHTSGIRDWWGLVKISGRYLDDVITDQFMMRLVMNQTELNFEPGESFQYSNTGYFLLARIISNVTGEPFRQWMDENVFGPLGMNDTHFSDDYAELIPHRARSYEKNDSGAYQNSTNNMEIYGSSCLISTLDDMIKWGMNYEPVDPRARAAWKMMLEQGQLNNKDSVNYGFGLTFSNRDGIRSYGHGGSCKGFLSQISYYPEQRLMYILICNRDPSAVYVDDDLLTLFLPNVSGQDGGQTGAPIQRTPVTVHPALLDEYAGVYEFFDNVLRIDAKSDHLLIRLPWEAVAFYPESENRFFRKDFDAQFEFLRGDAGAIDRLVYYFRGAANPPFRKLNWRVAKPSEMAEIEGEYCSPELRTCYKVMVRDERLVMWHLQNEEVMLLRLDSDHFLGDKWWCEEIEFIRDENKLITGLAITADGGNVQNLRFAKQ